MHRDDIRRLIKMIAAIKSTDKTAIYYSVLILSLWRKIGLSLNLNKKNILSMRLFRYDSAMDYQTTHAPASFTLKNKPHPTVEGEKALVLLDKAYREDAEVKRNSDEFQELERHYGHITGERHPNLRDAAAPENSAVIAELKQRMAKQEIAKPMFNIREGDRGAFTALTPQESNHFVAGMQLEIDEAYKKFDGSLAKFEDKYFASPEGKVFLSAEKLLIANESKTSLGKKAATAVSSAKNEWSVNKKLVVAGAVVALGAIVGSWVWKAKRRDNERATGQGAAI